MLRRSFLKSVSALPAVVLPFHVRATPILDFSTDEGLATAIEGLFGKVLPPSDRAWEQVGQDRIWANTYIMDTLREENIPKARYAIYRGVLKDAPDRSFMYWRLKPQTHVDRDFGQGPTIYRCVLRIGTSNMVI